MMIDLEIEDLNMGTINEYYNLLISRYGYEKSKYGRISYRAKISEQVESYVYSDEMNDDIKGSMLKHLNVKTELQTLYKRADEFDDERYAKALTFKEKVGLEQTAISRSLEKNTNKLRNLISKIGRIMHSFEIFYQSTYRVFETLVDDESDDYKKLERFLLDLRNRLDEYQEKYSVTRFSRLLSENEISKAYLWFSNIADFLDETYGILFFIMEKEEEFLDLQNYFLDVENAANEIDEINPYLAKHDDIASSIGINKDRNLFSKDEYESLKARRDELRAYDEQAVDVVYFDIMAKIGRTEEGKVRAIRYSPYIYLLIIYEYMGEPVGSGESLLAIDEAQNISTNEYELIYKINHKKVILNLFGDVNQHIENTKGLNEWKPLNNIFSFKYYQMDDNYRNTIEITNFCNDKFKMAMTPISLKGKGVHEIPSYEEMDNEFEKLFSSVAQTGLKAIIFKSREEVKFFKRKHLAYRSFLNDMVVAEKELNNSLWNLMTVDQAKGLEFGTVAVFSFNMTRNEEYIAFTRALNELFVCTEKLEVEIEDTYEPEDEFSKKAESVSAGADPEPSSSESRVLKRPQRRKTGTTVSKSEISLKDFFESKGLSVIDNRQKGSNLWVIGTRNEIGSIINDAIKKFGISGKYSIIGLKETNMKPAWGTKSKK